MRNIKISFWSILIGLTLTWILANADLPDSLTFIAVRNLLVQYSGVLSIGAMSVAMILATRAKWLESWLNGLDKSYRLHKWLRQGHRATGDPAATVRHTTRYLSHGNC